MPTLAALIEAHHARQKPTETPAAAVLTPRGHAVVAAHRFARALAALDPETRTTLLAQTVTGVPGTYSLFVGHQPTTDPTA
jgi:hypothetical protein